MNEAATKIELLECAHCKRLVFSVDDTRIPTYGKKGHGGGKCAGHWYTRLTSDPKEAKERGI